MTVLYNYQYCTYFLLHCGLGLRLGLALGLVFHDKTPIHYFYNMLVRWWCSVDECGEGKSRGRVRAMDGSVPHIPT